MFAATPPLPAYLALGDSYTIGEAVTANERWPAMLVNRLRRAGLALADPQIVAVTGWTTDELAHGMDATTLAPRYELVSLQIGVNNQYRGRPAEEYRQQFADLLARAISLTDNRQGRVVVVSIPDWGVTRFAREQGRDCAQITAEIDDYNAIARAETLRAGARFVDITIVSRQHPEALTDDGLHPCAKQYASWVDRIEPVVREALAH